MIHWSSLIADDTGDVDYVRVRALAAVSLAMLGGLVTAAVTLIVLLGKVDIPVTIFSIMVAALVLPLTGGKIADAVSGAAGAKAQLAVLLKQPPPTP